MKRSDLRGGDKSTASGVVVEGIPNTRDQGTELTYVGAKVACPACKSTGYIEQRGPRLPGTMMGLLRHVEPVHAPRHRGAAHGQAHSLARHQRGGRTVLNAPDKLPNASRTLLPTVTARPRWSGFAIGVTHGGRRSTESCKATGAVSARIWPRSAIENLRPALVINSQAAGRLIWRRK